MAALSSLMKIVANISLSSSHLPLCDVEIRASTIEEEANPLPKESTLETNFERGSFRICDLALELRVFEATGYPRALLKWRSLSKNDSLIHPLSYRSRYEHQ
jgi:hypothetical protein